MKYRMDGIVTWLVVGAVIIACIWGGAALLAAITEFLESWREWMLGSPQIYIILGASTAFFSFVGWNLVRPVKPADRPADFGPVLVWGVIGLVLPLVLLGCGWALFDLLGVKAANTVAAYCGYVFHHNTESWRATIITFFVLCLIGYIDGASDDPSAAKGRPETAEE